MYPWQIAPKLSSAIWGGDELVRLYGKAGALDAKLGESWECWDTDVVMNGPLRGATLGALRASLTTRFLGDLDPRQIFPILTKIITAHDWLSVQVHPDDAYARRVEHQPFGKTECWYVMAAQAGAQLVVGWNHDTSRAEYERRVADGTLAEILRKVDVQAGDTVYVPAGLVHAIGPGVTVFETQQACDLTYRMFDWNRSGLDGEPRQLNVEKAADVLEYRHAGVATLEQIDYHLDGLDRTALIADRRFTVERVRATGEPASIPTNDRPLIMMSLDESLDVECGGVSQRLKAFKTVVIPAAAGKCTVKSAARATAFLFVTPELSPDAFAKRMLRAGVASAHVESFLHQFAPVRGQTAR